jgi:hypothetical protein
MRLIKTRRLRSRLPRVVTFWRSGFYPRSNRFVHPAQLLKEGGGPTYAEFSVWRAFWLATVEGEAGKAVQRSLGVHGCFRQRNRGSKKCFKSCIQVLWGWVIGRARMGRNLRYALEPTTLRFGRSYGSWR